MITAKLKCRVFSRSGVQTKDVEIQVDRDTIRKASTDSGRKELNGWAKNFFPSSEKVEIQSLFEKK